MIVRLERGKKLKGHGGELDSSYSSHMQIYKRNAEDEWDGTGFSFFYNSKMTQSILIIVSETSISCKLQLILRF